MKKTTVYLPEALEVRLRAEAAATGVGKSELIRRGVVMLLDASNRPVQDISLPVFRSGRPRTVEEMGDDIHAHIKQRSARQ